MLACRACISCLGAALRTARLDRVRRPIGVAGAACVSFVVAAALVFGLVCRLGRCPRGDAWSEETWGSVKSRNEYCEHADTSSLVQTAANSFSNAGFICAGIAVIFVGANDALQPHPTADAAQIAILSAELGPCVSVLWGSSQIYVGVGSFLYHASRTPLAQIIDVGAIYSTLCVPVLYDVLRFVPWGRSPRVAAICFSMTEVGLTVLAVIYKKKMKSTVMLPALIATDVLLQLIYYLVWPGKLARRLSPAGWMLLLSALVLGGLAFGIRATDRGEDCPFPERGHFQAHALFHLLAAAALAFGYAAARAEIVVSNGEREQGQACDTETDKGATGMTDNQGRIQEGTSMVAIDEP